MLLNYGKSYQNSADPSSGQTTFKQSLNDCKSLTDQALSSCHDKLITELLAHPQLKGWEKFFTREMQRKKRLSIRQYGKLQAIAQRLGINIEQICSDQTPSSTSSTQSTH